MFYLDAYKYCPLCSSPLVHNKGTLECSHCHYKIYNNAKPCVNVILENKNGILLVRRKENPFKGWFDLPGGFMESGETLEQSAKREVKEETNLDMKVAEIVGNYIADYEFNGLVYRLTVFVVVGKILGGRLKMGDDAMGYKFVDRKKVLKEKICFPEVNKVGLKAYLKMATKDQV